MRSTLPKFDYIAPESLKEALRALSDKKGAAVLIAGGTDLLIKMRARKLTPAFLIGLKKVKELNFIEFDAKNGLTIGATALIADVASHPEIKKHYPAIAYAAAETATVQIRNMGTFVGNLCNASPAADNAPTAIAMNARIKLASLRQEREISLDEFFIGPGKTALAADEMVVSVNIPQPPPHSGASYKHISQRSKVDIPAAAVGAAVVMAGEVCKEARIALGAVAPIPMRALKTEKLLTGKRLTRKLIEEAAQQAAKECAPISDVRASADYRRKMIAVLTKRAILEAKERAK
ncbi:MAG: xanthine dehydrogenase family protein subunit M [Myxococcota bacterium]